MITSQLISLWTADKGSGQERINLRKAGFPTLFDVPNPPETSKLHREDVGKLMPEPKFPPAKKLKGKRIEFFQHLPSHKLLHIHCIPNSDYSFLLILFDRVIIDIMFVINHVKTVSFMHASAYFGVLVLIELILEDESTV